MIPSQQNHLFIGLLLLQTHISSICSLSLEYCRLFLNNAYYLFLLKVEQQFFLAKKLSSEHSTKKLVFYDVPHILSLLKKFSILEKTENLVVFSSESYSEATLEDINTTILDLNTSS